MIRETSMMTRFAMLGVCCLCLSAIAGAGRCGPNAAELKSFYNLMPDYSTVNGAMSPALSPDGKRLAFYAGTSGIWILPDVNEFVQRCEDGKSYPTPTPWELPVKKAKSRGQYVPLEAEPNTLKHARCIDWSPDGKSLAFVYDSRLYVAENLNFDKKTADARLLADLLTDEDLKGDAPAYSVTENVQGPIATPRWSSDGKKIAFTRWKVGTSNTVCVVDVGTGRETVLADDGAQPAVVWVHPWSPDGDCVVYGVGTQSGGMLGVKVASVDGSKTRVVTSEVAAWPSWSPASDEIAFSAMPAPSESTAGADIKAMIGLLRKVREAGTGIFVAGSHGENRAPATRSDPEVKRQIAAAVALMTRKTERPSSATTAST